MDSSSDIGNDVRVTRCFLEDFRGGSINDTDESDERPVEIELLREKTEDAAVDADADEANEAEEPVEALELVLESTSTGDSLPEACPRVQGHLRDFCEDVLLRDSGCSGCS